MKPILEINHVSKRFNIRHGATPYLSLRERLTNAFKPSGKTEPFWALKDIDFSVAPGESVGIIGKNGAGKSTLLKILSRITPPTTGSIHVRGRMASLLEVGTGFHQELTGRENVFMNGSILGMKKSEIKQKFDEIIDFAGTEKFLDTPLKHYSSGMQLRLAFAVAAHLDPDILIIDEVLAVGDAEFQKKCLTKMEQVSKTGRTILFVSHNLQAVSTLTSKAVWIGEGEVKCEGKTHEVINAYHAHVFHHDFSYVAPTSVSSAPRIKQVQLFTSMANNVQKQGDEFRVRLVIESPDALKNACLSFQIRDDLDRNYLHVWLFDANPGICRDAGTCVLECTISRLRLYMGKYHLKFYFTGPPGGPVYEELDYVCPFEVVMYDKTRLFEWQPDTTAYLEDWSWKVNDVDVKQL